jgi:hypothetical protein
MEQDLFNTPELLPQKVKDILAKYDEMGTSYDTCNNLIKELEQVGYTCEYGLDGIPYELKKIKPMKTQTPIYLVVRIEIEHDIDTNMEDIEDEVISNMDYNFEYYTEKMHISSTEICGTQNSINF